MVDPSHKKSILVTADMHRLLQGARESPPEFLLCTIWNSYQVLREKIDRTFYSKRVLEDLDAVRLLTDKLSVVTGDFL